MNEKGVLNILEQDEPPKPDITEEMKRSLEKLEQNDSVMILSTTKVVSAEFYILPLIKLK